MSALNFTIEQQQCSEWCWAAVTAALCRCYGDDSPTRQCEVANMVLNLPIDSCTDCNCQEDQSALCNQGQNLATVLSTVRHNRGNPVDGHPKLQFEDVMSEIDNGRPIVVRITLDDPAASDHAIAIYEYTDAGIVSIADPMHADSKITVDFAAFAGGGPIDLGELHGTWQGAYLTKARK